MAESPQPEESRFLSKKKLRKLSWVGVDEDTPYSTLKTILASAANSGFVDLQLVVVQND